MQKILVIEDEAPQALMLEILLKARGFKAAHALSGESGLEKAHADRPDLILLDINLPRMSGIDLCIELKNDIRTQDIPIVLLTASSMSGLVERCKELGVSDCVTKPYDMNQLTRIIERLTPAHTQTEGPSTS